VSSKHSKNKREELNNVFETNFGIEIEFSGIAKKEAAEAVAQVTGGTVCGYDVTAADGRIWQIVYDSSVSGYRRQGNRLVPTTNDEYRCELVSPILTYYRDIGTVQAMVYIMNCGEVNVPSERYFDTILDGYTDLSIDPEPLYQALSEALEK